MSSNTINFKFVILGVVVLAVVGIFAVSMLVTDDELVKLLYNIPAKVDLLANAPQATLDYLSVSKAPAPNYFTNCEFTNKIYYIDSTGTKHNILGKTINPQLFLKGSIVTDQTNREVKTFTGEIKGSCKVKAGFESLVPTIDSGFIIMEITGTKADGSTVKAYSKTTQLSLKGKNLSNTFTLFTYDIPASEIESKLPTAGAESYKSFLKIKPTLQLTVYFKGDNPNNKWTVGGTLDTSLRVRVNNDKFMCLTSCIINNKDINLQVNRPTNGELTISDRRLSFTVFLPEWTEDQGSPSYSVTDSLGLNAVPKSKMVLYKKESTNGIFKKDVLLPAATGEYTLKIEQTNRNTELATIKIVNEKTKTLTCTAPEVLVDGKCIAPDGGESPPEEETEGCDSDQIEKELSGIIVCVSPQYEWIIDNIVGLMIGFIVLLIILAILTRKRN